MNSADEREAKDDTARKATAVTVRKSPLMETKWLVFVGPGFQPAAGLLPGVPCFDDV
jgi:hypothetical protein